MSALTVLRKPVRPPLAAARIAWSILTLVLVAFWIAGMAARFTASPTAGLNPAQVEGLRAMGLDFQFYKAWTFALQILPAVTWAGVGLLVFLLKSNERAGLVLSAMMVGTGIAGSIPVWQAFARGYPEWTWLVPILALFGNLCLNSFFFVFPTGRYIPRWTVALAVGLSAFNILNSYSFALPATLIALGNSLRWVFPIFAATMLGSYVLAPFYRYTRVSTPVEREQIKWVVFTIGCALAVFAVTASTVFLIPGSNPETDISFLTVFVQPLGWTIPIAVIPLSIGISILRFHLFDIDLIIRRTLIYGALTALLVLVYFGAVVTLQRVFRGLTGQGDDLAIILSTLGSALLFIPLRNRVQTAIDHRFYRPKYNAARVLEGFGETVRDEVDLNRLADRLVAVVEETMQPEQVSLWLAKQTKKR